MKSIVTILLGLFICLPLMAADKAKEKFEKTKALAEKENAVAQFTLGWMYQFGKGVPKDIVTAYAWWDISAANGQEKAKEMLKKNPKLIKKP